MKLMIIIVKILLLINIIKIINKYYQGSNNNY